MSEIKSCHKLNDEVSVSVLPSKDGEGNDILIIPKGKDKAESCRSTTELVNKIKKDYEASKDEIRELMGFVSERLEELKK